MINAELYRKWAEQRGLAGLEFPVKRRGKKVLARLPLPDDRGIFWRGSIPCLLPYLRAYWKADSSDSDGVPEIPSWQPDSWIKLTSSTAAELRRIADRSETWPLAWQSRQLKNIHQARKLAQSMDGGLGYLRFLRADQLLECILGMLGCSPGDETFLASVHKYLGAWLVPLDEAIRDRIEILDRRVETVRMYVRKGVLKWTRRPRWFPDELRVSIIDGIDPVHTPENARAGLTRYLCEGWGIDDHGRLVSGEMATGWGPSSALIPHRHHDAPRRLMLGASLQSRGVPLIDPDRPSEPDKLGGWLPEGRNLRASFRMLGGWTHEDAVVLSESAANKLCSRTVRQIRVLVPSVASRVEIAEPSDAPIPIKHQQALARAYIDAYALGLRRHDAKDLGADDGWIEVALPAASAPFDGQLCKLTRQALRTPKWREMITFEIERSAPVRVGDKLSTRHGIKGVVSRILPDGEMPPADEHSAEIVLSPLSIVRRGAMGQLREAVSPGATDLPRAGTIFVMRQPQDADLPERCRVRGPERMGNEHLHHGQRYGEMEFWGLMAHGAAAIAKELLSVERSTAPWLAWEERIKPGGHHKLATRALNRFLAVAGVQIQGGCFVANREPPGVFKIEPKWKLRGDPREKLEDAKYFYENGGLGELPLGRRVRAALDEDWPIPPDFEERSVTQALGGKVRIVLEKRMNGGDERLIPRFIELDQIYILPPWLRPSSPSERHELTQAYWRLMTKLAWPWSKQDEIDQAVGKCIRLMFQDRQGAGGFLRREILGRRLTRSARAVIVPRPDLRIDQVAIPPWMADQLFEGLPDTNRSLVLVNRNPTLHRQGLLALRPVVDPSNEPHVFGLSLGILRALNADFDGDQASVVALETEAALAEAERLLPGAAELRSDPFRSGQPAFPFAGELADPSNEKALARNASLAQEDWCEKNRELQNARLQSLGDGWQLPLIKDAIAKNIELWQGMNDDDWRTFAAQEMEKVFRGVRRKGQLGGVLRREVYRRSYTDDDSFGRSVQALQAVTERMTQTALSVKSGAGPTTFNARRYFDDPAGAKAMLAILSERMEESLDADLLADSLGAPNDPNGLLAWMAKPNLHTLLELAVGNLHDPAAQPEADPRMAWFLD
ncbi:MAG: hypothetical protein Q8R92_15495 [Deltaproteobacteria bacterium]|nr:hypothetical protein [Deltaproteobacteria bacterium]